MQLPLYANEDLPQTEDDWTFQGAATRELTHCYHDYPARMIPQVAGKLLERFAPDSSALVFDPYCGTGTSLVESSIRGYDAIGTDLNPLARLIARAKTSLPDPEKLEEAFRAYYSLVRHWREDAQIVPAQIAGISRLEFWFKPQVIAKLAALRDFLGTVENIAVRDFFAVAFSETVRESSNTRRSEFKLYRYSEKDLERHNPDVFALMTTKLRRNEKGLQQMRAILCRQKRVPDIRICDFNTVACVPEESVAPETVDIVLTSPPYGDSQTTVAYGQYSRLSAAWLGFAEPQKTDSALMGGSKALKILTSLPSEALTAAITEILCNDIERGREVSAFYADLWASISHIAPLIKPQGYACYVVGNRKVKGVVLPTDLAIRDFFVAHGYRYFQTFRRGIPNKRMPAKNSPTNAVGRSDSTMLHEYLVVMQCIK